MGKILGLYGGLGLGGGSFVVVCVWNLVEGGVVCGVFMGIYIYSPPLPRKNPISKTTPLPEKIPILNY